MHKLKIGGKYKHHKGNFYRVISIARSSEDLEELVVYEALYDNPRSKIWVRPKKMFEENHQSFFDLLIFYLRIEAYSSLQTGDSVLNDWLRIKLRESLKRLDLRQRYMVKDSNMAIDVSAFNYFMPLFGFLLVFVVSYALLAKAKFLGENKFIIILVSFILAIIFVTVSSARQIVLKIVPWFAVLAVLILLIALIIAISQQKIDAIMKPGVAWAFIAVLIVMFIIAAIIVFTPILAPVWEEQPDASPTLVAIKQFITAQNVLGAILVLVVAAITAWVITRKE